MNENDFLYARREKMSEEFGKDLWKQLQEEDKKQLPKTAAWTAVAASLLTGIIGFLLVFSHTANIGSMIDVPINVPTFTQHDVITTSNIDQLQPFAHLGNGMVHQIQAMPDGEHLLIATSIGLFLHDANNLNTEPTQITTASLSYIDVDEQGNIYGITSLPFGVNTYPQTVLRWDAITYEQTELVQLPDDMVNMGGLSIKPDGSQLMIQMCATIEHIPDFNLTCTEQAFIWYDTASGEQLAIDRPNLYTDLVLGPYAIADDWSYMAYFVDIDDDPEPKIFHLQLMDITTHEIRTVLISDPPPNHPAELNSLMFSFDGERLLLQPIGMTGQALVMDTATLWATDEPINFWLDDEATLYRTAENDETFIWDFQLTPDGRSRVAQSNDHLYRYDLVGDTNSLLASALSIDKVINPSFIFSLDGQSIYGLHADDFIFKYDTATLELMDTLTRYNSHYLQEFQFTEDGSQVAVSKWYSDIPSIWTINTDPPTHDLFLPDNQLREVSQFALSPDGKSVAYHFNELWNTDGSIWIENLDQNTRQAIGSSLGFHDLRFLPDGTLLGIHPNLGLIRYTADNRDNPQIDRLSVSGMANNLFTLAGASRVTLSPDNQWVIVSRCHKEASCNYADFIVWNVETNQQVTLVTDENAFKEYGSMAFSPDGKLFAFGYCLNKIEVVNAQYQCGASEVRIYALDDLIAHDSTYSNPVPLEPLVTLTGFKEIPINIAFAPQQQTDGSWILAITEWHTRTQLWQVNEASTAKMLRILETVTQPVAFDPTSSLLFTTADTAQTEVWGVPLISTTSH